MAQIYLYWGKSAQPLAPTDLQELPGTHPVLILLTKQNHTPSAFTVCARSSHTVLFSPELTWLAPWLSADPRPAPSHRESQGDHLRDGWIHQAPPIAEEQLVSSGIKSLSTPPCPHAPQHHPLTRDRPSRDCAVRTASLRQQHISWRAGTASPGRGHQLTACPNRETGYTNRSPS